MVKVTTTATEHIEVNLTGDALGSLRIQNGIPEQTSAFLDAIVGTIRQIEKVMDGPFAIELVIGSSGVTVKGETK